MRARSHLLATLSAHSPTNSPILRYRSAAAAGAALSLLAVLAAPAPAANAANCPIPSLPTVCLPDDEEPPPPTPTPEPPQPPPVVDPQGADPNAPNPLVGLPLFVDSDWHPSWGTYQRWKHRRPRDARQIYKIARESNFRWFGKWDRNPFRKIRQYLDKVDEIQPGAVPTITIFRHPHPKHQNPNPNGQRPDARNRFRPRRGEYRRAVSWVRSFARGIGDRRVVIAFEPDSLGSMYLLGRKGRKARMDYLRKGVDILSRLPNATVYLEGGASDWRHAKETARQLRRIGVHKVRGFMLNVTHFDTTRRSLAHGLKISRRLRGKPFVISTHGNGNGPLHYVKRFGGRNRRVNVWCNPRNSALGPRPTTDTSNPKVDAYLWIGRAGFSAGTCRGTPFALKGGSRPGHWWAKRGLMMARRAAY